MAARLMPVDRVIAAWNVLMAIGWLLVAPAHPAAALPAALHAGAAAAAFGAAAGPGRSPGIPERLSWRRDGSPWLIWLLAWVELGALHRLIGRAGHDALIAGLDRRLPGGPWHRELASIAPWPWLSESAHFVYLSYYAIIALMPLLAIARRRPDDFRDATLRLVGCYLGCFAVSLLLPVFGPRLAEGAGTQSGLFSGLGAALRALGDSPGTAFPSSHCAGSVMAALVARRADRPQLATWMGVWAAAIVVSTVYTGNHYALDSLAGSGWALLLDSALGPRCAARSAQVVVVRDGISRSAPTTKGGTS
jgi:membrane-associated phospholipid phosphatase